MKRTLALLLALVFALAPVCSVHAEEELTAGIYALVSYEVGTTRMDAELMPNTSMEISGNGKGTFTLQGITNEITYGAGTICVNGVPLYTYTVSGAGSVRVNMQDVLYLNMEKTGDAPEAAEEDPLSALLRAFSALNSGDTSETKPAPAAAPEPTAVPKPAPSARSIRINFERFGGAVKTVTVYRGTDGARDGAWNRYADVDPKAISFTDETPLEKNNFYKVSAVYENGTAEDWIYEGDVLKEKWSCGTNGKYTAGYDYVNRISYEYVYEKNAFKYRKKTYEDLEPGVDYTFDENSTKIGNSTTYAMTLKQKYYDVIAIGFDFELTQVKKGRPFGTWRLYVRLADKANWKEAATFSVKDGNRISVVKKLKTPFSISRIALLGPNATYSCSVSKYITSITVKDRTY